MRALPFGVALVVLAGCEDLAVVSTSPQSEETGVALDARVVVNFNQAIDPATVTSSSVLLQFGGFSVSGTRTVSDDAATVTFTPDTLLQAGTRYTATVTTGVTDSAGIALGADDAWSFTTQ